jgi:hypothetical protein
MSGWPVPRRTVSRISYRCPSTATAKRFEVRNDVAYGGMRWITVGPADQPDTSIVLEPPAADPGVTDDERRTIVEMQTAP